VLWDAYPEHASGLRQGFENGGSDALSGQVKGRRKPGRAGADDGDPLGPGGKAFNLDLSRVAPVSSQPLEIPDRKRFILFTATAGFLASVGADPPQHSGQGQVLHDDLKGLFVLSFLHHLHIALHIQTGRAGEPARSLVRFLNRKSTRNSLSVLLVSRPPGGETLIVLARQFHRARLRAIPASRALGRINVTRAFSQGDLEVPFDS